MAIFGLIILMLAVVIGLMIVLAYIIAKEGMQLTFIPTGEIKLIVKGESMYSMLMDIPDHIYNKDTKLIEENKEAYVTSRSEMSWINRKWGIYWVSIFYPLIRVHQYWFEWPKLRIAGDTEGGVAPSDTVRLKKEDEPGKYYYIEHRREPVSSMYFRYAYPILAEEVELKGNFKVDILINVTIEAADPITAIFLLKGKWLSPVIAAIKGAVADYARDKDLDQFRAAAKAGDDSALSMEVKKINVEVSTGEARVGIQKAFGVKVFKVDFIAFDLSKGYKDVQEASTKVEIAELTKKAEVTRSEGEATAITNVGTAKASAIKARLDAANIHPLGGHVLIQELKSQGLSDFKGNVLSLGPDAPLLSVPTDAPKPREVKKEGVV